jgi:hypothetical protein
MRATAMAETSPAIAMAVEITPPMDFLKSLALGRGRESIHIHDGSSIRSARRREKPCGDDCHRAKQILHAFSPIFLRG